MKSRTICVAAHLHQAGADAEEQHSVFLVLCAELGHDYVQRCL